MFGEKPLLETTHPRIIRFYQENPQLDFETVNLTVIDLFEKTFLDASVSPRAADPVVAA